MSENPLKLHVFDVGPGDSLLLEFPDGKSYGIIDCHRHRKSHRGFGQEYNPDEPKLLTYFRYLKGLGIEPVVEFACLTHPHLDHYLGYATLLRGLLDLDIPIRAYWDFGVSIRKTNAIMQLPEIPEFKEHKSEMLSLLQAREELLDAGVDYKMLVNPSSCVWSKGGVEIDLLAPHAKQFEAYANYLGCQTTKEKRKYRKRFLKRLCFTDRNKSCKCPTNDHNVSSAFLVKFGKFRLLLGGDISDCAWRGILSRRHKVDPSCHCIKVSHHGSIRGNKPYDNQNLWRTIKYPNKKLIAIISGGYRIGLPHEETINDLQEADCDVYCTGPQVPITHKPYVADSIKDMVGSYYLETICFIDSENDICAPDGSTANGDGNILIECYKDGSCKVHPELERYAYTSKS